jgi:MYXO-CTERM domain-containing protein
MGGCGCNVADDEARWVSLAMAGVVVVSSLRRRRRVTG